MIRVWDCVFVKGWVFVYKVVLGILKKLEELLLVRLSLMPRDRRLELELEQRLSLMPRLLLELELEHVPMT